MRVTVNGEPLQLPGPLTVSKLARQLQLKGRIAIEINRNVVPRSRWPDHTVADGDHIEVVRAIGGG